MTQRERFGRVVRGEPVDRLPRFYGGPRASTMAAWRRQGLSSDLERRFGQWIGAEGFAGIGKIDCGPLPRFEERTIEERGNVRIWVDHWGVKRLDAIRQATAGFATRQYLEFPVKSRADFEAMRWRFDPRTQERLIPGPDDSAGPSLNPDGYRVHRATECWRDRVAVCNEGEVPVCVTVPGLFWTARDWCGFEGLCTLCSDDPPLVEEMMSHWTDFLIRLLEEPLRHIRVDLVILNEDMAYKHASMISPAMMRRYMVPGYRRLRAFFRDHGVRCVCMDTDGHCAEVLSVFYPECIDGITPMEIAANNDADAYLREHAGLFVMGGIDKRELRGTQEAVRAEVLRCWSIVRKHPTYIPTVDHGVPPDVPLRNFLALVELLQALGDGADPRGIRITGKFERDLGPIDAMFDPLAAIEEAYASC